jgi:hypothetical protein
MRHKLKSGFVLLIAMLALGAVGVSSASAALPEFSLGVKERLPATFEGKIGTNSWSVQGIQWSWACTSGSMSGSITGEKTISDTITFNGCKSGQKSCRSEGAEKVDEIKTQPLTGTLVYINKTTKTTGILFKPTSGTAIAKLLCFGDRGEVKGSIVMAINPRNTLTKTFTLEANPAISAYEGIEAALKVNFSGIFETLTWEFPSTITTQAKVEIKA